MGRNIFHRTGREKISFEIFSIPSCLFTGAESTVPVNCSDGGGAPGAGLGAGSIQPVQNLQVCLLLA